MQTEHLTLRALFDSPQAGVHQWAGHRAIIIDAAIVGFSRRAMRHIIGPVPMKQLLARIGFVQGWRSASSLIRLVNPLTPHEAGESVQHLLTLLGMAHATTIQGDGALHFAIALERSCEAEEHVRHCGPSAEPVCWVACGFVSGYMTRATARLAVCREEQCMAAGAATCRLCVDVRPDSTVDVTADPFADETSAHLVQHLALHESADGDFTPDDTSAGAGMPGIHSTRMRALIAQAARAASSASTVLITGESGVGKERLAAFVHQHSTRRHGPFIPVNCGALPDTLLENELFGHRRGAFTGAIDDRPGLIEAAHNGTLFLDEIGELLPQTQVKLLRVLQEHEVRRLGETRSRRVDVRVIAATNRDLQADVRAHRFREDLYYRLNVVSFHVPPLRERAEDLRALIDLFLRKMGRASQRSVLGFTPRALDRLLQYHWPGNIRELENAIERACVLATRPYIDLDDLPSTIRQVDILPMPDDKHMRPLAEIERDYILFVLRQCHGNKTRAAQALHICQDTLHRKLKRYRQLELTESR